ncbi:MAG TPA: SurA N-terminal domain-containing protein [Chryseosolibacter sp.]|nr:SurA N-terminal domain-containing protein [Chryseosolibacter sp.]
MALIGTLRDKMGIVLVGFIFVALVVFILEELLSNKGVLFNQNKIGDIDGNSISVKEFQSTVEERRSNYILNFNRQPGEREMTTLRQQAWDLLISRYAIAPQYEKVGIAVTDDEVIDMISGTNIDPNIRQAFVNQQTGEFDRAMLNNYINQLKMMPEGSEGRVRWDLFQRDLKPARERIKYENLLLKTNYVTKAEAEREYHLQTDVAEVKFVYVPYYAVSDSVADVKESDLRDYYDEHKEQFKTEHTRDLKYVVFPVVASAQDTMDIRKDIEDIAAEFSKTKDDSLYAVSNSDSEGAYQKYNVSSIPSYLKPEDLKEGNLIGPFIDGNSFKVVKISKIYKDTVAYAQASHILIKWDSNTPAAKKAAREKAQNILNDIRKGADFAAKAREFGQDGTAANGGDLGWVYTGQMVKPFEQAVFGATSPGLVNRIVETEFGYHIIKVTRVKDNTAYEIGVIEKQIVPSDATANEAYRTAENFTANLSGAEDFEQRAKTQGLNVLVSNNVTAGERRIGTLGDARQVVQWLFRDASEDEVSEIFDLQDQYVVAVMTGETKKGYRPMESVADEIRPEVRKKVKGNIIIGKLKDAKGTLEEIASTYGNDANVYSSSDLKLISNTLPTAGFDPKAVGIAFGLENGKRSNPVLGENGVLIIELQNKTIAPEVADYTAYKTTIQQRNQQRSGFNIAEAIKDKADIEDLRYKFY